MLKHIQCATYLSISASIQISRGNKVISLFTHINNGVECGGGTRAESQCGSSTLHCGKSLLQNISGRIHDSSINVTELLQSKQLGCLVATFEDIWRGAIERHTSRGGFVGKIATMKTDTFESTDEIGILAHLQLRR